MGEDKIPQDSDMEESPWDLSTYPAIRHLLEELQQVVTPRYKKADRAALRHQRWHRWTTSLAAFFGTAAILFAVFQLTGFFHSLWPMWAEIAAAIVAFTSVLLGVLQSCQSLWLIERHKAERFRMLKFRSLISPALWRKRTGDIEKWRRWLLQETQEVEALGRKALRNWVHREVGDVPSAISGCTVSDEFLDSLLSYYRNKRVAVQMAYFHRRAERYEGIDKFMRNFPPVFFFLSVICAFLHFAVDVLTETNPQRATWSIFLVTLTVSFPVLGAGIRAVRGALEFARSASLYRAKYLALAEIGRRLEKAKDAEAALREMWHSEQFLEDEHREWLRLMLGAEWFG